MNTITPEEVMKSHGFNLDEIYEQVNNYLLNSTVDENNHLRREIIISTLFDYNNEKFENVVVGLIKRDYGKTWRVEESKATVFDYRNEVYETPCLVFTSKKDVFGG